VDLLRNDVVNRLVVALFLEEFLCRLVVFFFHPERVDAVIPLPRIDGGVRRCLPDNPAVIGDFRPGRVGADMHHMRTGAASVKECSGEKHGRKTCPAGLRHDFSSDT
jgi:hypothetical protein